MKTRPTNPSWLHLALALISVFAVSAPAADTPRTMAALQTLAADNSSGAITAQVLRDMLVSLNCACGPEIAVTGAVTATVGQWHACSGTSADYTVTLPAAAGCSGRYIGFRMAGIAALSKLVTIDGNLSETIDGATVRVMWAGESALLYCDGSNWFKVAGKTIPMLARMGLSADQSGVASGSPVKINLNRSDVDNTGVMVSTGSSQITIKRTGNYTVGGKVVWNGITTVATNRMIAQMRLTDNAGAQVASGEVDGAVTTGFPAISGSDIYAATAADVIVLCAYQDTGSTANAYGAAGGGSCSLLVQEIPSW